MIFLLIFVVLNSVIVFALSILLVRNIWLLGSNMTTIEGWEMEKHEALIHRAKPFGGYLDGPDGVRVKISRHEFPYDVGIFRNIQLGMGGHIMLWLWPFAPTPNHESGLDFETNGFEGKFAVIIRDHSEAHTRQNTGPPGHLPTPIVLLDGSAGREATRLSSSQRIHALLRNMLRLSEDDKNKT